MNEKDQLGTSLHRTFAPHEPAAELRAKVLGLRRHPDRKPLWLVCAGAGLAAAATVAVFVLLPSTSLAQAVVKQAEAFEGHCSTYTILPSGRWEKTSDEWIQDGKQRSVVTDGSDRLNDLGRGYSITWNAGMGAVRIRRMDKKAWVVAPMPQVVSIESLKSFLAGHGADVSPRVERTVFRGVAADCVTISMNRTVESKVYADPETHSMLGWSYRNTKVLPGNRPQNNYTLVLLVEPKPFPAHIFDPVFNVNGVPTDVLAERAKWQERLSKPLKVYSVTVRYPLYSGAGGGPVESYTVAVRSVTVNSAGDVFVLFTGVNGEYGKNVVPTTVHDASGGRYIKAGGFMPNDENGRGFETFSFDGKLLEGAWFVRTAGGSLKGPISVGFKQEADGEKKLAFTYTAEPERITHDVPSYMPYMAVPVGTHLDWLEMRTDECAEERNRAKDFAGEEHFRREAIALEEQNGGRGRTLPVDEYCFLARALENQGKKHDAYLAYQKAQKALAESPIYPGPWEGRQISEALARLK